MFFFGERLKFREKFTILEQTPFFVGEHLRVVSLVLALEQSCPWPRESLSSESRALEFFCDLGFEPCVFDSTFDLNDDNIGDAIFALS